MSIKIKFVTILVFSLLIILFILPAQLKPWTFPSDDCYFYLQIAKHIAASHGSTFNQITPTNGYHPLWMLFCVMAAKISAGNNVLLLRIIVGFQAFLFLGILYYFTKIAKLIELKYFYVSIPFLALYFLGTGVYTSECHLNGLIFLATLYYLLKYKDAETRMPFRFIGFLLGLLFLARLDNIFIIGVIFIYLLVIRRKKLFPENLKLIILTILPFLLIIVPYLAWNYINFGQIMPISGAIKSSFPRITFEYSSIGIIGKIITLSAFLTLLIAITLKNSFESISKNQNIEFSHSERSEESRNHKKTRFFASLRMTFNNFFEVDSILFKHLFIIISLGVLLQTHYYVMFSDHLTNWLWYFVTGLINLSLILPFIIERVLDYLFNNRNKIQFSLSMILTLLLTFICLSRTWSEYFNPQAKGYNPIQFNSRNKCDWLMEIANQLNKALPKGTPILMYDWPGKIAYFSDMRILPIDGLVNDFEYQRAITEKGIVNYLKEKNIHYFIGPYNIQPQRIIGYENFRLDSNRMEFKVYSSQYNKPAGSFIVDKSNLIIRFRDSLSSNGFQDMVLWRIY